MGAFKRAMKKSLKLKEITAEYNEIYKQFLLSFYQT